MEKLAVIFLSLGLLCSGSLPACLGAAPADHKGAVVRAEVPQARPLVVKDAGVKDPAPRDFVLQDVDGHRRTLADFRGRPVALYFFCGCSWCRECAQSWGQLQRGGSLAPRPGSPAPYTVVVFSGGAGEARAFAAQAGLDRRQTALLLDPALRVTEGLYHAEPCPRVFVLDSRGRSCYTNTHSDDAPRTAPALAIASRVLTALRACEAAPGSQPQAASVAVPTTLPGMTPSRRGDGRLAAPRRGLRRSHVPYTS